MAESQLRVLLLTDDADHGRALAEILDAAGGVTVTTRRVVTEGPLRLNLREADAVLVGLSGSDDAGLDVVARTVSAAHGKPVVVVARWTDVSAQAEAFELGVQDYLPAAGTSGEDLAEALGKAVLRQRRADELAALQGSDGQTETLRLIAAKNTQLAEANALLSIMMRELKRSWSELVQTEKLAAVGRLAAGAAHELNNPIMGVLNYVQYCRERTNEDDPRHSRLVKAESELRRCERIVRGMLTSASAGTGQAVVRRSPVQCRGAVERAVDLLAGGIDAVGARLDVAVPAGLPPCNADPDWLQQVLINLISNAEDAVAGQDDKRIVVDALLEEGFIRFLVTDTGCGMSLETQQKAAEPFYTTKPVGQGTGLGMTISRNFVTKLGGKMRIDSRLGEGTTVGFTVPVWDAGEEETLGEVTHDKAA